MPPTYLDQLTLVGIDVQSMPPPAHPSVRRIATMKQVGFDVFKSVEISVVGIVSQPPDPKLKGLD